MKLDLTVAGYIFSDNKVLLIHHGKLNIWIPVGGHIDPNESPDQAIHREVKEETNLDIELIGKTDIPKIGNIKEQTALPFYTNIHSVGDHDHYCLYYVCQATNATALQINNELKDFEWFTKDDLVQEKIPVDVQRQALLAFSLYEEHIGS